MKCPKCNARCLHTTEMKTLHKPDCKCYPPDTFFSEGKFDGHCWCCNATMIMSGDHYLPDCECIMAPIKVIECAQKK